MTKTYTPKLSDRLLGWSDNEIYGHGEIMRQYTTLNRRTIGHLQHGWNPSSGWTLAGRELLGLRSRRIVWGTRQLEYSKLNGIRVAAAVGAPWLYSSSYRSSPDKPLEQTRNFSLLIPLHGTSDHPVLYSHQRLIDEAKDRAGSALRVCLHHNEFRNQELVEMYINAGFEVVTAGSPFSLNFLQNLAGFYRSATETLTNRISTAALYSSSLGTPVSFLGGTALIAGEHESEPAAVKNLQRDFGEARSNPSEQRAIALQELGEQYLQDPESLAEILGMTGTLRAIYPILLGGSHLSRLKRRFF